MKTEFYICILNNIMWGWYKLFSFFSQKIQYNHKLDQNLKLIETEPVSIPEKAKKAIVYDKDGKEVSLYPFYKDK